ncbi:MAG: DUF1836 domain-containing protein [Oscillospiraceae bacterium]|nr:DUF1836 domain-containing protein [Oscillospiraceae bacterium]
MERSINEKIAASIRDFKLPDYDTIPDVGLYLEQTVRFIAEYLEPLPSISITSSMVGNYVKKGLIANPVKKLYDREQIAYLIFIAVAKTVLSLEDIQLLINLQKQSYDSKTAYQYFVNEFINVLYYIFGLKDRLDEVGEKNSDEKTMLRNTIITVAHKIYLDKCFAAIH